MIQITNGNITISTNREEKELQVTLEAGQYRFQNLPQYESFLKGTDRLLPGKILQATDEQLQIAYQLPEGAVSLEEALLQMDDLEKLALARGFGSCVAFREESAVLFLHPQNLFLSGGQIQMAHRGLVQCVEPEVCTPEDFMNQYKALVIAALQEKLSFADLVQGQVQARDAFSKAIMEAEGMDAVETLLNKQYRIMKHTRLESQRLVNKGRYTAFRWMTAVFAISAIGLGVWAGFMQAETLPRKERMIESQMAFIKKDYDEATITLEQDDARSLPKGVQYILAESYIHLEALTTEQKEGILNNLSTDSSENALLYWIESGRGKFEEALSIAQNIGDHQLILHGYTKLYDATKADTRMSGEKKQELLSQYEKKMEESLKLLNGEPTEEGGSAVQETGGAEGVQVEEVPVEEVPAEGIKADPNQVEGGQTDGV
jgi:type VII secretion protein EssB